MEQHITRARTYVILCATLLMLTGLTVGISYVQLSGGWHLVIGLAIALCKATLVALFFMDVVHSPRVTWMVILVTIFWLLLLLTLTLVDYETRNLIPFMPGH